MVKHLIYAYYIESTGLVEVWRSALTNFSLDTGIFRVDPSDAPTLNDLNQLTEILFGISQNTVNPDREDIRLLWYYKLYGKTIPGKEESFPKVGSNFNIDFEPNFRTLMTYIVHGILDTQTDTEKLADPSAIAQQCHLIQNQIKSRYYNNIEVIADDCVGALDNARIYLGKDNIMVNTLNIKSLKPEERLIEFGKLLDVPVTNKGSFYFSLADNMVTLLDIIMNTDWSGITAIGNAENFYTDANNVKMIRDIATSYRTIYGIDFFNDTLKIRRGTVPPQ